MCSKKILFPRGQKAFRAVSTTIHRLPGLALRETRFSFLRILSKWLTKRKIRRHSLSGLVVLKILTPIRLLGSPTLVVQIKGCECRMLRKVLWHLGATQEAQQFSIRIFKTTLY